MWIVNWTDEGEVDAERDDARHHFTMEAMAEPRGVILTYIENIDKVLKLAYDEVQELFEDDDEQPTWRLIEQGEGHRVYHLSHDHLGRNPMVMLIARLKDVY